MKQIYKVNVATGICYECIGDTETPFAIGDEVIVRCERYLDFGTICTVSGEPIEDEATYEKKHAQLNKGRHIEGQKIPQIIRKATAADKTQSADNNAKALEAHNSTQDRIRVHKLDMKLIHTHYAFDRKLLVFQFSAEGRVDFRELLRDLSSLFRIRVELRQVGVRDEAAILGGIGTCGRPFCCASFLPSFNSINVKMAKQQGLSLNPQNISGCCGRLKCCLQYEAECYRQAAAELKAQQPPAANTNTNTNTDGDQGETDTANEGDNSNRQPPAANTSQRNPPGNKTNRRGDGTRGSDGTRGGDGTRGNRPPNQRRQRPNGPLPPRNPNKAPLPPVSAEDGGAAPAPRQPAQPEPQSPAPTESQS